MTFGRMELSVADGTATESGKRDALDRNAVRAMMTLTGAITRIAAIWTTTRMHTGRATTENGGVNMTMIKIFVEFDALIKDCQNNT